MRVRPLVSSERTSTRSPASTHTARCSTSTGPAAKRSPRKECACATPPRLSRRDDPHEPGPAALAYPASAQAATTKPSTTKRAARLITVLPSNLATAPDELHRICTPASRTIASRQIDWGRPKDIRPSSSALECVTRRADVVAMPTNRDHPWLRDSRAVPARLDPVDPKASAMLHVAKQEKVIDEAREATSVAPPDPVDGQS